MTKFNELATSYLTRSILYGDSGTGKTTLAAGLANDFKLIWASVDNGHAKIMRKLALKAQMNIDVIVLPDTRDFPIAFETVRQLVKGKPVKICGTHGKIDCGNCARVGAPSTIYNLNKMPPDHIFVLDHATSLTDSNMNIICKKQPVDYKPVLDDWGALKFHMTEVLKDLEKAQYNHVCIAQTMEAKLEDGTKKLLPNVGSYEFGRLVGQHFDNVIYCEMFNGSHKFSSMTTGAIKHIARSRDDIDISKLDGGPSLIPFYHKPSQQELDLWHEQQQKAPAAPSIEAIGNIEAQEAQAGKARETVANKNSVGKTALEDLKARAIAAATSQADKAAGK